jgi:diacylglycerol kinase family enzyme
MARIPLIYNPFSGTRTKEPDSILAGLAAPLREKIEPIELTLPFDYSEAIGQATKANSPLIVWGGDGTIHHAAKALLDIGCPVPLAAIPGGSGNGLTGGLRTPDNPIGALCNLLMGRELLIDVGRIDGEPFFNVAGCGFEGDVAHAFAKLGGSRGFIGYAKLSLKQWRHSKALNIKWDAEIAADTAPMAGLEKLKAAWRGPEPGLPDKAWSLCFANLPQYGSSLWIAPGADPTDGALQWVSLSRPSLFDMITEMPQLFRERGRTKLRAEGRLKKATVYLEHDSNWHLDGEPAAPRDRTEVTLEPKALRMMVIRGCPWE